MLLRQLRLYVAASILLMMCGVCSAVDFSAERVYRCGDESQRYPIMVSGDKVRVKMRTKVVIYRSDKQVLWELYPDAREYVETRMTSSTMVVLPGLDDSQVYSDFRNSSAERSYRGPEHVSGYRCRKVEYRYPDARPETKVTFWYSDYLGCPIKGMFRLGGGLTEVVEYQNIRPGRLAGSLFEIPRGYRKVSA